MDIFVDSVKFDKSIIGIIVCGSFIKNKIDKNSDIDIHLILKEVCDYRERGNTWINGVEIEYFKNPPRQIRNYFKKEKASPHTADMLAKGKLIFKKSQIIDDLIDEANSILAKKPKELTSVELEISKYHLDDLRKDLEDCLDKKERVGFGLVKNKIIDECIAVLFGLKRIRKDKRKRLFGQIKGIDPDLAKLIRSVFEESDFKTEKLKSLIEYTETLLGGERKREWVLKGKLDI